MNYTIQWDPDGTLVTFKGAVEIDDIMHANSLINSDERYYSHAYSIWDLSDCDLTSIHAKDLNKPVAMDFGASLQLNPFKQAIVVNDSYSLAMSQLYIEKCLAIGLPWQFKIFDNVDDATKWCKC